MSDTAPAHPPVVDRATWRAARVELLAEEKALTRARDAVSARRRRLPMVRVDDYELTGPDGRVRLRDLFGEHRQLVVYHFMFDPSWERGCPSCTHLSDEISPGHLRHLADGDTAYAAISRAPIEQLEAYRAERGWTFPWYSSFGTTFNRDFHVTIDADDPEYNFRPIDPPADGSSMELPGLSCFLRVGDDVFHTYSTFARGGEGIGGAHYLLDLTAYGRQQDWEDSPAGWPQRPTYG